jgi:hypothetical protein
VLDLFDKRWTVLTDLRAAVGQIVREAKVTPESESMRLYATARDQAAFLFGPKVTDYLESINKAMGRLYVAEQRLSADEAVIDQKYSAMVEISEFFERTNELMMPYMRMHQRAPSFRTPASWWRWQRSTGCLAIAGL